MTWDGHWEPPPVSAFIHAAGLLQADRLLQGLKARWRDQLHDLGASRVEPPPTQAEPPPNPGHPGSRHPKDSP